MGNVTINSVLTNRCVHSRRQRHHGGTSQGCGRLYICQRGGSETSGEYRCRRGQCHTGTHQCSCRQAAFTICRVIAGVKVNISCCHVIAGVKVNVSCRHGISEEFYFCIKCLFKTWFHCTFTYSCRFVLI